MIINCEGRISEVRGSFILDAEIDLPPVVARAQFRHVQVAPTAWSQEDRDKTERMEMFGPVSLHDFGYYPRRPL